MISAPASARRPARRRQSTTATIHGHAKNAAPSTAGHLDGRGEGAQHDPQVPIAGAGSDGETRHEKREHQRLVVRSRHQVQQDQRVGHGQHHRIGGVPSQRTRQVTHRPRGDRKADHCDQAVRQHGCDYAVAGAFCDLRGQCDEHRAVHHGRIEIDRIDRIEHRVLAQRRRTLGEDIDALRRESPLRSVGVDVATAERRADQERQRPDDGDHDHHADPETPLEHLTSEPKPRSDEDDHPAVEQREGDDQIGTGPHRDRGHRPQPPGCPGGSRSGQRSADHDRQRGNETDGDGDGRETAIHCRLGDASSPTTLPALHGPQARWSFPEPAGPGPLPHDTARPRPLAFLVCIWLFTSTYFYQPQETS